MRDCSWIFNHPHWLENIRPDNFKCCSDRTNRLPHNGYNCIAWAAGKTDNWWWPVDVPDAYWPIPINPTDPITVEEFIKAFATEGYYVCKKQTAEFENGFEKIAIYVDADGEPTHAARLLPSGVWTSKMGKYEDIEHLTPQVVEGRGYGKVKIYLKKPNPLCQKQDKPKTLFSRLLEFLRTQFKKFFPTASKNQISN